MPDSARLMHRFYDQVYNRRTVVRGTVIATHIPTGIECSLTREYWRCYDRHDLYDGQLGGWRPGAG